MIHLLLYLAALSQLTDGSPTLCTVSGPSVIDFSGKTEFIPDRCAYTLISGSGLELTAIFKERRRKDVSFLDQVILRVSGVNFNLGQSGTVQQDGTTLTLSSTPMTVQGVKLSKDVDGVTAEVSTTNGAASIVFDGTTAQILVTGTPPTQGLCVNSSSSLSSMKVSEFSPSSCGTLVSEPADSQIDCIIMTDRCNLLKEAPFTSCHSLIDPAPYIKACTNMLCKYPVLDGVNCQFLQAYTEACSLKSDHNVTDWRTKTGCSDEVNEDVLCSAHEFVGMDISGDTGCLCRANFAATNKWEDGLGNLTVCSTNGASVSLASCLLVERGIDYRDLHLKDDTCRGQMDEKTHMVTFTFNSSSPCGREILATDQKITYKNAINIDNNASSGTFRSDLLRVNFSCYFNQPTTKSLTFKIKGGKAMSQIESGSWNYTLAMTMCEDMSCTKEFDFSNGIQMDQTIYMSLDTFGLDGSIIVLVVMDAFAIGGKGQKYYLAEGGCVNPQEDTVKIGINKNGGSVLAFQMFQFKGENSALKLGFKMKLCLKSNKSCMPQCKGKRRGRSTTSQNEDEENVIMVSVDWN